VPTKEKAEQLIKKIKGGAKFEDVAKAESTDNSKANGGDLGWFTTARMVKTVRRCRQAPEERRIHRRTRADPVRLAHHQARGYARRAFDQMKVQLSNAIMQKKFQDYIEGLKKTAKIEKKL